MEQWVYMQWFIVFLVLLIGTDLAVLFFLVCWVDD